MVNINISKEELKEIIKEAIIEYEANKKAPRKVKPKEKKVQDKMVIMACTNIITAFNVITSSRFKPTEDNLDWLIGRIVRDQACSIVEALAVIKYKTEEWKDNEDMAKYLRLSTLFNKEKCNNYVGMIPKKYQVDKEDSLKITNIFINKLYTNEEMDVILKTIFMKKDDLNDGEKFVIV